MRPYVYEALDLSSSTFRLVRLVQGEGPHIECDLVHAALYDTEDAIEYEALSYTWGGSDKSHEIEIDGTTLNITESLFDALVHLRYKEEDRILWIDAICIDQDDHKERGHQVRQMAAIYENARQVVIWLGLSTPDTDSLFSCMQQLERQALNYACNDWAPSDGRWKFLWSSVILSTKRSHGVDANRQRLGFTHLLTRPWFHRIWILQEVAKARRAKVMCGDKLVSSRIFAVVPNLLGISPTPHQQAVIDIMPGSSRKHSWWVEKRDLCTLLSKFMRARASDSRDNIYALLGISSDAHDTEALRPDYNKSLAEVVKTTVAFLLGLDVMDQVKRQLPSWTWEEFKKHQHSLQRSVFIDAWQGGQQQLAEKLFDHGLKATGTVSDSWALCKNFYEQTPLAWAAQNNRKAAVEMMLAMRVPLGTQDWLGRTPLHLAVENGHEDIVMLLLQRSFSLNQLDWCGRTPLSRAAGQGQISMVKMLLQAKFIDVDFVDKSGWTPLSLAEANGHHEVASLLRN